MEWYWILILVVWALPVGFFLFAGLFVDGKILPALIGGILWPLWLPLLIFCELATELRRRK